MMELWSARASIQEEQQALDLLQAEVDSMSARADSLRNDPLTLERLVRERHGMIREGEILYRFADDFEGEEPEDSTESR
jgi:cell division protein FtsB